LPAGDTVQVVFQDLDGLQAPAVCDHVALERA
jgi:hypothetical protein